MYHTWVRASTEQGVIREKEDFSNQVHNFTGQLVHRVVNDARTDPALFEILKKHFPVSPDKGKGKSTKTTPTPAATPAPSNP